MWLIDFRGYEFEVATVHLDRGYDYASVRELLSESGIEAVIPMRRKIGRGARPATSRVSLGERWPVERANSWLTNFGLLRRTTDRKLVHRETALDLTVALMLTTKLVRWRKRFGPVFAAT
jgi:transposase